LNTKVPRWLIWGIAMAYWGMCFVLTHLYVPTILPGPTHDKIRHYLGYGGLGGAWFLSLWVWRPRARWIGVAVIVLGAIYGGLDEITQPAFGRTCDFYDWLADLGGTVTAVVGMILIQAIVPRRTASQAMIGARD
jgi:VanZ family protein